MNETMGRQGFKGGVVMDIDGLVADHSGCFNCPHCGKEHHCPTIADMESQIDSLTKLNASRQGDQLRLNKQLGEALMIIKDLKQAEAVRKVSANNDKGSISK